MWDLIVSVPDHCLSFYFALSRQCGKMNFLKAKIRSLQSEKNHKIHILSTARGFENHSKNGGGV